MLMIPQLILSYIVSLLGVKYLYKEEDNRFILSFGLFLGSIVALLTLIIYLISKKDYIFIPVIISAIFLILDHLDKEKNKTNENPEYLDNSNSFGETESGVNAEDIVSDDTPKNNKPTIDDLIN